MAVYAWCGKCNRRRDAANPGSLECDDKIGHKRFVGWVADTRLGRKHRDWKLYSYKLKNPKELADARERGLKTDFQRGDLNILKKPDTLFGPLADKYWAEHSLVENHKPERSTYYTLIKAKAWIGEDRKVSPLSDDEMAAFQNDMRSLQRKLRGEGLAGASVNRYFNIMRAVMEKGREWGLVNANPLEFVSDVQTDEPAVRFLEQSEIDKLFATVDVLKSEYGNPISPERKDRLREFMTVLGHTGARPSSIADCNQDNGDLDLKNLVIFFTTYKGGRNQKKHRYPVPIDDVLLPLIIKRVEATGGSGPLFDCLDMVKLCRLTVEQSGINKGKPEKMHFTMYGLKHCYASHLLMNGASIDEVGELLGHTDGRMVRKHYKHLTLEHLRKVQSRINLTPVAQLKVV